MTACTHSLSTPGRPCPWCGTMIAADAGSGGTPASAAPPAAGVATYREGVADRKGSGSSAPAAPTLFDVPGDGTDGLSAALPAAPVGGTATPRLPGTSNTPRARTSDPASAHQAAHRARSNAAINADRCLLAHGHAGTTGLTGDELEQVTGIAYQTIGPRRPALEDAGLIAKARDHDGRLLRRTNRKGNPEQVYVITAAGRDEIAARQLTEAAS